VVRFVDLSHALADGMEVFPGLPRPRIGAVLDHHASRVQYDGRAEFYLGMVEMPCNIGTYVDSPFHRFPTAADLSHILLEQVAGVRGVVLDPSAADGPALDVDADARMRGAAVLVRTGWDAHWGHGEYWRPCPHLSQRAVERLVHAAPALVGIDTWNVDDVGDPSRPAHTRLLAAGVLIVENLCNLHALPSDGFRFYAVPPRVARGASFPVRAFAELAGA